MSRRCTAWAAWWAACSPAYSRPVSLGGTGFTVQKTMLAQLGVQALGIGVDHALVRRW